MPLDALAERVAAKVRRQLAQDGGVAVKPRLLTVDQAAIDLARSKDAVQHMVASRKLPVVRDGRRVFIDSEDLERWIDANKESARD